MKLLHINRKNKVIVDHVPSLSAADLIVQSHQSQFTRTLVLLDETTVTRLRITRNSHLEESVVPAMVFAGFVNLGVYGQVVSDDSRDFEIEIDGEYVLVNGREIGRVDDTPALAAHFKTLL